MAKHAEQDQLTDDSDGMLMKLNRWQKGVAVIASVLMLSSFLFVPFTFLYESHQANIQAKENTRTLTHIENTEAGIKQLLDFVASVQHTSSTGSEQQQWYAAEIRAICEATHCTGPALPPSLSTATTTLPKK